MTEEATLMCILHDNLEIWSKEIMNMINYKCENRSPGGDDDEIEIDMKIVRKINRLRGIRDT